MKTQSINALSVLEFIRRQQGLPVRNLTAPLKNKSINFFQILTLLFVTACTNDFEKTNRAYSFFRVGMFEAVLKGEAGNQYKGLIYEFGLGVEQDIAKAMGIYSRLSNKHLSNGRLFMLCFIHCTDKMDRYYHASKRKYNLVVVTYAIDKAINGEDCNVYVDDRICNILNPYFENPTGIDLYYEIGRNIYEEGMKAKIKIKDFELPYYLLTKSAVNGNQSAKEYLESIPYKYSWIPNLQI